MNANGYNGWTNYETWAVALWLDNEEGSQCWCAEQAEYHLAAAARGHEPIKSFTPAERATLNFAEELKVQHEEALPELHGFAADLLNAAMSEVNWHEIAGHYVDEAARETAEARA